MSNDSDNNALAHWAGWKVRALKAEAERDEYRDLADKWRADWQQAMDERDALAAQVSRLRGLEKALRLEAQRREERDALAAHVERFPLGAVINGQELLLRLADHYQFECEGGSLSNCVEFQGLERCFVALLEYAQQAATTTSLARRDLLNQAKGVADAARRLNNMSHPKAADFFKQGAVKHLEYQADKLRRQAEEDRNG